MKGLIQDKHWQEIETNFPGMHQYYLELPERPETFLDLLRDFLESNSISHKSTTTDQVSKMTSANQVGAFL